MSKKEFGKQPEYGWWIPKYEQDDKTKYIKKYRSDERKSRMFLCMKCNQVWQSSYGGNIKETYYDDFPTYKLKRKICNECKRTQNEKTK